MVQLEPGEGLSPVSPPPGAHPVFFFTDRARSQLREKQKTSRAVSPMPNIPPTPEQLDFEERLDRAVLRSTQLLQEVEGLLERLHLTSEEVDIAPSETAEYQDASTWTRSYDTTNQMNSIWLDDDDDEDILDEITELLDLGDGTTIPDDTLNAIETFLSLPFTRKPKPPPETAAWLSGSWNFREYRDADFEAEQRAMHGLLSTPRNRASTFGAAGLGRKQSSPGHSPSMSMPDAAALIPSIKRMYTSAQESLSRSSSPNKWQNLLKLDTKMRWS